jgi:hypothetical protein
MKILFCCLACLWLAEASGIAETYEAYVARHKRIQKMVNPMNVPVANALNDQWDANPQYANPNNRVSTPGPKKFYIKSSRDDQGRVTCIPRPR